MRGMHSATKGEREAVRQLVHSILVRDLGTFTPDRFRDWVKSMDARFRRNALALTFKISDGVVHFTIKEIRSRRTIFEFNASTHVRFEESEVVMQLPTAQAYS